MVERPRESFWDVKVPCKGTYGSQPDCPCIWHLGCIKETAERLGEKAANLIVEILDDKSKEKNKEKDKNPSDKSQNLLCCAKVGT